MASIENLVHKSFDEVQHMYFEGRVDEATWDEYQWLWRNSTPRVSSLAEQFEGKPAPSEKAQAMLDQYRAK